MELTIKVELDVTPALQKLLEAFAPSSHGVRMETKEPLAVETANERSEAEEKKVEKTEKKTENKQTEEISNVALRDAMEEVRKKYEFTDPNNPDVADPILHKKLTLQFKEIARSLDADKPTALPQEKREEFLEKLTWIKVEEKTGEVTCLPF